MAETHTNLSGEVVEFPKGEEIQEAVSKQIGNENIEINQVLAEKLNSMNKDELNKYFSQSQDSDKYYMFYGYLDKEHQAMLNHKNSVAVRNFRDYATKNATMIDVDRATTSVYRMLLKMIKLLNIEIEEIKQQTGITTSADVTDEETH